MHAYYAKVAANDPKQGYSEVNLVGLNVHYSKGRGMLLTAYPCIDKGGGSVATIVTAGESLTIEEATRDNKKRVDSLALAAKWSVDHKQGVAWGLVLKVCETCGLTPA